MAIEKRVPMRELEPEYRIKNFKSVPLGYTKEEVVKEASRCLQCPNPTCEQGCPVKMDIKNIINEVANENFREAFILMKKDNAVPAITGRVCPQEDQCEGKCVLQKLGQPINIGKIMAYVADWARKNKVEDEFEINENDKKVAIVGSGPAAITCAVDLRKNGVQVTMYEALHMPGGVLQYGIPPFRLPRDVVNYELDYLNKIGTKIVLNHIVGQNTSFDELRENYDAVFLATGAGAPIFLNIEGEKLKGVYSANEFLLRTNLMKAYKFPEWDTPIVCGSEVGVVGCGNVAMDAARCAIRHGAKHVYILYRRTRDYAPARNEEIKHAEEEGVIFEELVSPTRIIGDENGWIKAVELIKNEFKGEDKSGRPRPIKIEGSEYIKKMDTLIMALGTRPNRLFLNNAPGLKTNDWGVIQTDDRLMTNLEGVFAGGDALTGGSTVIEAMGHGRKAAKSIVEYINERSSKLN